MSLNQFLTVAQKFAHSVGTHLLLSSGNLDSAKRSILWLFPYKTMKVVHGSLVMSWASSVQVSWDAVSKALSDSSGNISGNWSGYFSYEMGFLSEKKLEEYYKPSSSCDAYFQLSALQLVYEHTSAICRITFDLRAIEYLSLEEKQFFNQLLKGKFPEEECIRSPEFIGHSWKPGMTKEEYTNNVRKIQELILNGEVYQQTLSHEIEIYADIDPFAFFLHLVKTKPTSFSGYLQLNDKTILSLSPERLIKKEGSTLETRPIKGTRQRGKTVEEDKKLQRELITSTKEVAELVMITDLMRSDLSKVCIPGTVVVPELLRLETYSDLFHRISVIQGQEKEGLHPVDIIRTIFPGGSVTGCPKIRAMELIHQIEARRRSEYTGSMGYFLQNGDFDFNIMIRTIVVSANRLSLQVGCGIVIDSDPDREWEESLFKANHVIKMLFGEMEDVRCC